MLLWLGEGAYELRYGRTLRALVTLLHRAGVDFAVLGEEERDCGDLARRLGDEATFQRLARENIATLARYSFKRILTADPHALHALRNEYRAFGGDYEVVHHAALLDELVATGRLPVGALAEARVTYHDPCYLGRYNGEFDAPRRLLDRLGLERLEMERSGKRSMCCGGGGGAPVSDIEGERRIPDLRMGQAAATGAAIVAVACPQCSAMLEGVTGERPQVADIAELVLMAADAATTLQPVPARMSRPRKNPRAERAAHRVDGGARPRFDLAATAKETGRPRRDPRAEERLALVPGTARRRLDRTQRIAATAVSSSSPPPSRGGGADRPHHRRAGLSRRRRARCAGWTADVA